MKYNYLESMVEDVKEAIKWDYKEELKQFVNGDLASYEFEEQLHDDLWIDDSVTGNGSGSYFFNNMRSIEAVQGNMDLCVEALQEFCVDSKTIAKHFLDNDYEYFDVTIRCHLLGQAIAQALEELENVEG